MHDSKWKEARVIVTGGASFIGSHLVDNLVKYGAIVTVVDNLTSGKIENLDKSWNKINFINMDLEHVRKDDIIRIFKNNEKVFHLAAVHGGRGFITTHPADITSNVAIDHHVFEACVNGGVEKVIFASTACVYPPHLQEKIGSDYTIKEEDSNPANLDEYLSADIEYGWSKLMSEIQMISFKKQYGLKGCPVRFVTAYGPRENETHAIIALIYKALQKMDPFEIWGSGQQERDFTYVEDIVEGSILAAERISDCMPINLGTGRRYKIIEVVDLICKILNWKPSRFKFDESMPVGVLSRALNNSRAMEVLGWKPRFTLEDGLQKTIKWYKSRHKTDKKIDTKLLFEHG
jgi:nucleoside-diphosphate-sugar epimerase